MRTALTLIALAGAASAQANLVITADGPVSSYAVAGSGSDFDSVPGGTVIGRFPNTLDIGASVNPGSTPNARSVTLAYPSGFGARTGLNFFERSYCRGALTDRSGTSASATANGANWGGHSLLATFTSPTAIRGELQLSFRADTDTTGTVGAALDIGNDGTVEFSASSGGSFTFPISLAANTPLVCRLTNQCEVTGTGNVNDFQYCWTELYFAFVEAQNTTCAFNNYGAGCGGATAAGADVTVGSQRVVTFVVNGAFPNMPVINAIGDQQLNVPLLAGCNLLCNAIDVSLMQADATGTAVESYTMPLTMAGRSFHQFLPIDIVGNTLVVRTTNGIDFACN